MGGREETPGGAQQGIPRVPHRSQEVARHGTPQLGPETAGRVRGVRGGLALAWTGLALLVAMPYLSDLIVEAQTLSPVSGTHLLPLRIQGTLERAEILPVWVSSYNRDDG